MDTVTLTPFATFPLKAVSQIDTICDFCNSQKDKPKIRTPTYIPHSQLAL